MLCRDKLELGLEGGHRGHRLHQVQQPKEHVWEREGRQVGLLVAEHGHLCPRHGCMGEEGCLYWGQGRGCHHIVIHREELNVHHLHHHHLHIQVGHIHPLPCQVQWQ